MCIFYAIPCMYGLTRRARGCLFNIKCYLTCIGIPIIKIRKSSDRLIFIMGILHLERRSLCWNGVFMTARNHWRNLCIKSWLHNCVISQDSPDMRVHLVQPTAPSEYYCWMFTLCLHCFAYPTWHIQYRLISNRWVGLSWPWAYIAVSMIDLGMCKLEINALALLTAIYSLRLININSRITWLNITLIVIIYQLGCVMIDGSKSTKATKSTKRTTYWTPVPRHE